MLDLILYLIDAVALAVSTYAAAEFGYRLAWRDTRRHEGGRP